MISKDTDYSCLPFCHTECFVQVPLDLHSSVTGGECISQSLVHRTQVSLGIFQKEFVFVAALAD